MSGRADRARHCEFFDYTPDANDYTAWEWVHVCCGGPWIERPAGHYIDCPNRAGGTGGEA